MYEFIYSPIEKVLHWVSAVVILWASLSGLYMVLGSVPPHMEQILACFNVSLTTAFVPIFAMRAYVRYRQRGQPANRALNRIAHAVHQCLYLLTAAVLTSGLLMMGRDICFFGWFHIPNIVSEPAVNAFFAAGHKWLSAGLFGLVVLHILAVTKHEINGTRILRRML